MTQAELARRTELAPATISNIVHALKTEGTVTVERAATGKRRLVQFTSNSGLVAGFDYGHRHLWVAVADRSHQILADRRVPLGPGLSAQEALELGAQLLEEVIEQAQVQRSDIRAAGMGLPAPIEDATGEVGALSILPGWVGVHAAELASEHFGMPVYVDNEANLGAWSEHLWGAGQDAESLAFVKLSEGVGAGLVVDGRLFRGRNGTAGEIGHTTVRDQGQVCRCGNRGCLETVISARAVVDLLQPRFDQQLSIAEVVRLATEGDIGCLRVLSDTGHHMGLALADLCNLMNPELILIGGEMAQAGDLLLGPLRESVRRSGIPSATAGVQIRVNELGEQAVLLGAIALALDHMDMLPGE